MTMINALKYHRILKGYSQDMLARKVNVKKTHINYVELGKRRLSEKLIKLLAEILRVEQEHIERRGYFWVFVEMEVSTSQYEHFLECQKKVSKNGRKLMRMKYSGKITADDFLKRKAIN